MHEWREHTAEIELVIDAASPEQVFVEAALAFAELVGTGASGCKPLAREVRLEARDRGSLLVDWLEELIYLADTEGFVPAGVQLQVAETSVSGTVAGCVGTIDPLVKAATYHGSCSRSATEGGFVEVQWVGRVLDAGRSPQTRVARRPRGARPPQGSDARVPRPGRLHPRFDGDVELRARGLPGSLERSFGTTCHGAGRLLSTRTWTQWSRWSSARGWRSGWRNWYR